MESIAPPIKFLIFINKKEKKEYLSLFICNLCPLHHWHNKIFWKQKKTAGRLVRFINNWIVHFCVYMCPFQEMDFFLWCRKHGLPYRGEPLSEQGDEICG